MALADILDAIRSEADEEQERLIRLGEERVRATLARAESRASEREAKLAASRDEEAADDARAIRNRAHLDVERAVRRAREEAYSEVMAAVQERLERIRDAPGYTGILAALIDECRAVLPDASVLRIDAADAGPTETLADGLTVHPDLTTCGGVILETDDGRRVINTLEERLDRAGPLLRREFAERAGFGDG